MTLSDLAGAISLELGLGAARGAKALARAARRSPGLLRVATFSDSVARALKKQQIEPMRVQIVKGRIGSEDGIADALCGSGLPLSEAALPLLYECARVVKSGGCVLIATPSSTLGRRTRERSLVPALMLHAGLQDVQQMQDGSTVVTIGRR